MRIVYGAIGFGRNWLWTVAGKFVAELSPKPRAVTMYIVGRVPRAKRIV